MIECHTTDSNGEVVIVIFVKIPRIFDHSTYCTPFLGQQSGCLILGGWAREGPRQWTKSPTKGRTAFGLKWVELFTIGGVLCVRVS